MMDEGMFLQELQKMADAGIAFTIGPNGLSVANQVSIFNVNIQVSGKAPEIGRIEGWVCCLVTNALR